jgi:hypothetical protein
MSAASHEIVRILWYPKVHHRINKRPPPVSILSHISPVHAFPSHFLKIHFNIIVPSMRRSDERSILLRSALTKTCMLVTKDQSQV